MNGRLGLLSRVWKSKLEKKTAFVSALYSDLGRDRG